MANAAIAGLMWVSAAGQGQAATCDTILIDQSPITFCKIDLTLDSLRLWLRDDAGKPYGSFDKLNNALSHNDLTLGIAMNAGMYHDDRAPVGHYVEDGQQEQRLITSEGPGNFGMLPNGVLCLNDDKAAVIESREFAANQPGCQFATQSGPMLVIDGKLHPRFLPDSDSFKKRNGVGVLDDGKTVVIAISDRPVNFHLFARFFRDVAQTPNALFLDGTVSQLYAPQINRRDSGWPMGPILGTVKPRG